MKTNEPDPNQGGAPGSPDAAGLVRAEALAPFTREYLSEEARQTRHALMLVSTLAVFVALTGFVPEKVEFLGIEFTTAQKEWFAWILLAITVYFLAQFVVHFWRAIAEAGIAVPQSRIVPEIPREFFGRTLDMRKFVSWFSGAYLVVELIVPMIVGVVAIIVLIFMS